MWERPGVGGSVWHGIPIPSYNPAAPQPASVTHKAPAAACARCCQGSVSASPTSSADAVTAAHPAATALDPWGAAVSNRVCWCVRHARMGPPCLCVCLSVHPTGMIILWLEVTLT